MSNSSIEWTEITWNPTTGCSKVSSGCKFCYAEVMTRRLKGMGQLKYQDGFSKIRWHDSELSTPAKWKKPSIIFVNSMSDLFHPDVPESFIVSVFIVMQAYPQHTFQVLTKRSERLAALSDKLPWPSNVWMGVSIEDYKVIHRLVDLKKCGAATKFLSLEPLLGPLCNLDLEEIDWVIVGGESGRKPRPIQEEWIIDIRDQCNVSNTLFFFKQWGGVNKKRSGRLLLGEEHNAMPYIPL